MCFMFCVYLVNTTFTLFHVEEHQVAWPDTVQRKPAEEWDNPSVTSYLLYSTAQLQGCAVEHRHTTHGNCSLNVFLQSSKHWLLHCYSSCNIKDIVYWGDQFSLIENCGKCNMKVTTHWKYSTSIDSFAQQANTCTFPSISIRGGERKLQMHGISTNISVHFDWYCLCLPHRIVCTTFPRLL